MTSFSKALPVLLALCLLALLSACSLAADVTPPPGYQPPTPESQPVSAGPVSPQLPPDPAQGAAIYTEKCAPCHGETGLGDGPQASKLSNPVAAIGSPSLARASKPADWFNAVSQGNIDKFMPGFANSLSEQQRWDVLAYVYSLGVPAATIDEGKSVYQANCASCHGPQGGGDGPQAGSLSTPPGNLGDLEKMAARSQNDLFQVVSDGSQPAMPGFAGKLSEDERWAVVQYVRTLGYNQQGQGIAAGQAATPGLAQATAPGVVSVNPEGTPQPAETAAGTSAAVGSVSGQITNGSGGPVPAGLEVTLHGFDTMQESYTKKTTAGPDGKYAFPVVDMPEKRVFMVSVEYKDATFSSEIAHSQPGQTAVSLPLTIYEPTTDASAVSVERMHVFFDFSNPGTVQVVELYVVSNTGTQTVVSPAAGQPILKFDLPQGAQNLQFQEGKLGERYVKTDTGFGDTASITPGDSAHQVLFAFDLPYPQKLDLSLPVSMDVKSAVLMVPKSGVQLKSTQLQDGGQRDVQGMTFQLYTADNLTAGSKLPLTLSGDPNQAAGGASPAAFISGGTTPTLLIGLAVFALALMAAGFWLYRLNGRKPVPAADAELEASGSPEAEPVETEDADALIDAIAALDDLYQSGKLPEAAYRERRAELKARLAGALK